MISTPIKFQRGRDQGRGTRGQQLEGNKAYIMQRRTEKRNGVYLGTRQDNLA